MTALPPTSDTTRARTRCAQVRPGLPADPTRALHGWSHTVETWTESLSTAGRTPSTVAGYAAHLGWLAGDLAATCPSPWDLTRDQLDAWLAAQAWSNATRSRVLVSLRSFYSWGVVAGLCRRSPVAGIGGVPRGRGSRTQPHPIPSAWIRPLGDYLTWLRSSARAESTIENRRERLSHLARAHADPWAVSPSDLAAWLSRPDWAPAYKRQVRAALRGFYRWAHRLGHVGTDPTLDLDSIRVRRALPRPTPDDAVRTALAGADDRTRLALGLAMYAGLRCHEIAALHVRDIGEETFHVVGKGGHERTVPLHPDLAVQLRAELHRRHDGNGWGNADGWLFPGVDREHHLTARWMSRLLGSALPDGWTAHTLRHRFATQAYRASRDLRAVQELLGHAKPETTARYAAVDAAALTHAVLGVGPPSPA